VTGYATLLPEILLLLGAFLALFSDRLPGGDRAGAICGAVAAVAAAVLVKLVPIGAEGPFGDLLVFDGPARFARVAIALLTAIWLLWTVGRGKGRVREGVALALFAAMGAMLMAGARELITFLVSLELATIPAYVLIGYRKGDVRGLEGALKYFLLSMLATLVTLYGFSFLYGISGTTYYAGLDLSSAGVLGVTAAVLSLVGIFAKLSAAPFHYWAPDAYEGATPSAVAFVATVPKIAGAVAIIRLLAAIAPGLAPLATVVAVVSAASMLLGNLGALTQTDVRRLMAYSAVAHTGYLLVGVTVLSEGGASAAVFYVVAYAFASMGVMLVAAEEGPALTDWGALAARRPVAAWGVIALLLSLIGIPPTIGFFGKLYLFVAALDAGQLTLVLIAVVMSVVSAGYYLRIAREMFFAEAPVGLVAIRKSAAASLALALCVLAVLILGVCAGPLLAAVGVFL